MKDIFTSRKFWTLAIGLAVMFAAFFFPSFKLDEEAAIGLTVIVFSYILGVAVDPGPGGWRGVFGSRKFWAALVGLAVVLLKGFGVTLPAEIPQEAIIYLCVTLGTYIGGVALEGLRQSKPAPALLLPKPKKN